MSHTDHPPLHALLRALSSPRLTVALLALAIWLVFWATLDQVHLGIHEVVQIYFRRFLAYYDFRRGGGWDEAAGGLVPPVPVFRMWMPGGYLVGLLLLVNLLAAGLVRFRLGWSKAGIVLVHLGIVVILLGELGTGLTSLESRMTLAEGQTTNYSEAARECELAVVDVTDPGREQHFAIPQSRLDRGAQVAAPGLPFRVEVVEFMPNARLDARKGEAPSGWEALPADQGVGRGGVIVRRLPRAATIGGTNQPAALVRLHEGSHCLGTWVVSVLLDTPQRAASADGRQWHLALRPRRVYLPFSLTLRDFQHNRYPGTDTPKDFSSFVTLTEQGLDRGRDVRIWMNHPLRHGGYTFYQASFADNDTTSVLQVVRNPVWVLPYLASALVCAGLAVQFGLSLARHLAKRKERTAAAAAQAGAPAAQTPPVDRQRPNLVLPGLAVGVAVVAAVWSALPPRAPADAPDFTTFGRIPVVGGGRLKPLDTVARNALLECSGRSIVRLDADLPGGLSQRKKMGPDAWLAEVLFDSRNAGNRPTILVENEEVKALFGKQAERGKRFPMAQVATGGARIEALAAQAQAKPAQHRDVFERQVVALYNRLTVVGQLFHAVQPPGVTETKSLLDRLPAMVGRAMPETQKMQRGEPYDEEPLRQFSAALQAYQAVQAMHGFLAVPPRDPAAGLAGWRDAGTVVLEETARGRADEAVDAWARIGDAFRALPTDRGAAFNAEVRRYLDWLDQSGTAGLGKAKVEWWFNHASPFRLSLYLYAAAFLLVVAGWLGGWDGLRRAAFALLCATLVVHTGGLVVRIWLSGRPPVTNLYSSAVFIGWFVLALCLVVERWVLRNGIGSSVAAVVGFGTLVIAHHLSFDGDTLEVKQAVLDSNFWLTTHVLTVTIGYCATFMAGIMAIVWLAMRLARARILDAPARRTLAGCVYGVVCFALLFSFTGTVTGGIWGDQAWGRFWGWDPKENGALILVLWNAIILHARWGGMIGERGLMACAIAGTIVTAWSWFGTNMLGIGLHTYGFMESAFRAMVVVDIVLLALVALVALVPKDRPAGGSAHGQPQ